MKKFIRNSILAVFAAMAGYVSGQTVNLCAGSTATLVATNNSNLSNPTYSLNPGALTSINGVFYVSPLSSTVYTLYTTGTNTNSTMVTTTSTVLVNVSSVTYTVIPNPSFTLVCGTNSATVVQVQNVQTFPNGGGAVSYTFLPPGFSGTLQTGTLSTQFSNTITLPGVWNVVVRDNNTGCDFPTSFTIVSNITYPMPSSLTISQNPLNCNTPTAVMQVAPDPALQFTWLPWSVQGTSVAVNANTATPSQTLLVTATLVITDINTQCVSEKVIPIYQNVFPPIAKFGSVPSVCTKSVQLTNQSMTGIPANSPYPTNSLVVAFLWEGPSPQVPLSLSSVYNAYMTGQYTLTTVDMNNGCKSMTTTNVMLSPAAAFVHTLTGGQAVFNDMSSGTSSATTYFWDFGDGNTSTLQNPTHTYLNAGAHAVKLKIKNPGFLCQDSIIQSVNVSGAPCTANSNFSMVPTGTAQVWNVVPSYPWNISSARWDWGDGSSSNTLYTSHQYSAAGLYQICLSVTVSCVASSSTCSTYSVYRVSQQALIISVNVVNPDLISGLAAMDANAFVSWNIAPNPNDGNFKIHVSEINSNDVVVRLTDLSGRVVHEQKFIDNSPEVMISTQDLSPGLYFVTLKAGPLTEVKRMMIK